MWQNLPDVIFSKIMMTVGLESLGVLQKCRGVCKTWNVMICQMTRNEKKAIIREVENLAAEIQDEIEAEIPTPLLSQISTIAYLAYQAHQPSQNIPNEQWHCTAALLCSLGRLALQDVDLASVAAEHLASLAICIDSELQIINVRTATPILDNIECKFLVIRNQSLGIEETQSLVRAMESRVQEVELHDGVSLNLTTLTQYSGHGKCEWVGCYGDTADKYMEEVRSWGERMNWKFLETLETFWKNGRMQETVRKIQIDCMDRNRSLQFLDSLQEFVPGQPYQGQSFPQNIVPKLLDYYKK